MSDNYSKVKNIRKNNECLFKDFSSCNSQGKCSTEKNHLIQKASYLARISDKNKVLVFDFENRDYIRNKRKLTEKKIDIANRFHVLCGKHDKLLFDEIENGKFFDENNKKQLFQFALRAFIFSLSEEQVKNKFDNIVSNLTNKIGEVNLACDEKRLNMYKSLMKEQVWEGVETKIIKLNRTSNFISCLHVKPSYGFVFPIRLTRCEISINIFPENGTTIVLLAYLKDNCMDRGAKRICDKLVIMAEKNEDKFVTYMNKFIAAFDHNIAISPVYWRELCETEREIFYRTACIFPECKNIFQGFIGFIKLKYMRKAPRLIV